MAGIIVAPEEDGLRLDHVLARLVPGMGLRGRRRLCAEGRVLVNGRPEREARKVRPGDALALREDDGAAAESGGTARVVLRGEHLAALHKPSGMHSEALAGKTDDSLQTRLSGLLPGCAQAPRLLNRLDFATSGLVLAALDGEGRNSGSGLRTPGLRKSAIWPCWKETCATNGRCASAWP